MEQKSVKTFFYKKKVLSKKICNFILIFLFIFLIYYAVFNYYLYDETFYNKLFIKHNTSIESKNVNSQVLKYFKSSNYEIPKIIGFNDEENSHMKDVKAVIRNFNVFFYIGLILFLIGLFFCDKKTVFRYGGLVTALTPLIFLLPFDVLFYYFHKPFFTVWQYPADYLMVNVYTADFFNDFAIHLFLTSSIAGFALFISSFINFRRLF